MGMAIAFLMALPAKAQTNVYMHMSTQNVPSGAYLNFYDSGGPASTNGDYYWEKWYGNNENATMTFKDGANKIKVTFNAAQAWGEQDGNINSLGNWALRINDDHLYIYDGELDTPSKLIADLTGNIKDGFSVMADGPITFKFVSNGQYREEGWYATVTSSPNFEVQPPVIVKNECADVVDFYATTLGATIYYSIDGSDPSIPYTGNPVAINLDNGSVMVKAKAVLGEATSTTASRTFTQADQRPTPGVPTITFNGNMVTMTPAAVPAGLNDTYYVRYTTDGSEPAANNGTVYSAPFEWTTPNTQFRAITQATVCPAKVSDDVSANFGNVTVPTPVIAFNSNGTATITCTLAAATIYYTTDGSDPTTGSPSGTSPITTATLTAGTTVKAYAVYNQTGFTPSAVASAIYIPEGGSGTYGGTVFLDDREDHSWSYYSDATNPIRSLNPADVKITYFGNGTNTVSTSNDANPGSTFTASTNGSVKVGIASGETQDRFVYLKTLERENGDAGTGNCAYTTIPNPFQVRPTYGSGDTRWRGFYGWRVKRVSGGSIQGHAVGGTINAETQVTFVPDGEYGMEVELEALWARAYVVNNNTTSGLDASVGYERNFMVLRTGNNINPTQSNNRPYTLSSVYPNGTSDGNTATTSIGSATVRGQRVWGTYQISLSSALKLEYITMNGNSTTLSANGHDLVIGRGVTGTVDYVRGMSDNSSSNVQYAIRIESGTVNRFSMIDNMAHIYSGTVSVSTVLGCDYDRAKNDNSKLNVAPNNTIYGGDAAHTFNSAGNRNNLTYDWTIKSGKVQGSMAVGDGGADKAIYIGNSISSSDANSVQYVGKRRLTMEGGEVASLAGGVNCYGSNYQQYGVNDGPWTVMIRIKGGTVRGSVYGAAAYAGASHGRRFVFTGGSIAGWIAGGCNGTRTTGGELYGNTYIYFGGNAQCSSNGNEALINSSRGGNIFGAGSGIEGGTTVGRVDNSTVVIADNAFVERNVYGGGNYGYVRQGAGNKADLFVLGGTVNGNVFGGANQQEGQIVNLTMKNGTVQGNLYGGSNITGTVNGLATVSISGGTVANVFGGGYGSNTTMGAGTAVNVSGGTINNNVYGGGDLGTVSGNTSVSVSGGTMNDVFGAGKGTAGGTHGANPSANIVGSTSVTVTGGTLHDVYGGGENGTVAFASNGNNNPNYSSTVTVKGGTMNNVFGGGMLGTTQGATTVTVEGGSIRKHVFGGAFGEAQKVFVTGLRTVNILGGHVYGNVYGGSRNANDANNILTQNTAFGSSTETGTICVTNISGGQIDQNVYGAGFFGNTFGSVYVFIGQNAIENAPNHTPTSGVNYAVRTLGITASVWAGSDWGTFQGTFGDPTISGNSNIYVDGTSYETQTNVATNAQYMNIGGSIIASGTSCDAGKGERTVIVREYGHNNTIGGKDFTEPYTDATRTLYSIQRAKLLILDNAHINFTGLGKVNSLITTEKYGIYEINGDFRFVNGSAMFLNAPVSQIRNFKSMSCNNVYSASATYTPLAPGNLAATDNEIRVNGGNYIEVKYDNQYGELSGFAYMMAANVSSDNTCAYARPKNCVDTPIGNDLDNPSDGGFVSHDATQNTYDLNGNLGNVQMRYENHTIYNRNGEQYFRIWRAGGIESYREAVFNAHANGEATFTTVDVTITLPAFHGSDGYYRFETVGDGSSTSINYGADVLTFNAARENGTGDDWMYYDGQDQLTGQPQSAVQTGIDQIMSNPDVNFGLVVAPGQALAGGNYIVCPDSDGLLAASTTKYTCNDNTLQPQVTFRLTYSNQLSSNMTWDPMRIVMVQCDASGNITEKVTIALAVNTSNTIEQEFNTKVYAIMQGKGSSAETFTAKVTLPTFLVYDQTIKPTFTVNSVEFVPANGGNLVSSDGGSYNYYNYAMQIAAGLNYDNTDGWQGGGSPTIDAYPLTQSSPTPQTIGNCDGRSAFAIDFTLRYDGSQTAFTEELIGTLTFNIVFNNYKNSAGQQVNNQPLTINVEVWRRGQGTKFYLDGVNGSNANDARHPDKAAKVLSTIFNRSGYLAGDEIYIVNAVTSSGQLTWNGLTYDNVTLYRYDGGHALSGTGAEIIGNPDNEAYTGILVNVNSAMTMRGITLDGSYKDGNEGTVAAAAPMINIANGGVLQLNNGVLLQQNNNTSGNGGAVVIEDGGTMMMNNDAEIKDNKASGDGAGVYMNGTLIVSDNVKIYDNKKGDAQNNVFLTDLDETIQIGKDGNAQYGALGTQAHIGLSKNVGGSDGYVQVVYVEEELGWLDAPYQRPNTLIVHDAGKFQLEKYSNPNYLYWLNTWVTLVTEEPDNFDLNNINYDDALAWVISLVNGENGQIANPNLDFTVTADIDMSRSIWVPIGNWSTPYQGEFEGNGHVITGLHSTLVRLNMGMFGRTEGAKIANAVVVADFDANATNLGVIVGEMIGGTLSQCEAAGTLTGGTSTENLGGLVGHNQSGTIHSSFSVARIVGGHEYTYKGGLVGWNEGNIYNSYSHATLVGNNKADLYAGGLAGWNGHVTIQKQGDEPIMENCYAVIGDQNIPAFACQNDGLIQFCYSDKAPYVTNGYVGPSGHGTYGPVKQRKELGYMYDDNKITLESGTGTPYVAGQITYANGRIDKWPGMLSTLNQWVKANPRQVEGLAPWFRPTSSDINGDLPVLGFAKDNCLATTDGKYLQYSAFSYDINATNNGLDDLLTTYNAKQETSNVFLYGNAVVVKKVPANQVNVFVNEDAALLLSNITTAPFKATVGVTFDNSCKNAYDYYGNRLYYDWHLMSSPLSDAPIGTTYDETVPMAFGTPVNITSLVNSYLPNGLPMEAGNANADWKWDFYSYYEPEYHWINLKRSSQNHWHIDNPAQAINYTNETTFVPGKGYMMAISKDSYLSSTGYLNHGNVAITLTNNGLASDYNPGANLLGNPYHGYLDLNAVANTGYTKFYVYDAESGVYVPFTHDASQNPVTPSRYLHPHQAFFVLSDGNDAIPFTLVSDMATAEKDAGSYFRSDDTQVNYPLVNLFAENETGNRDLTIIELHRPALGGAAKINELRNANFQIAASMDGQRYGILFTPEGTARVPVHFIASEDGTYTLRWSTHNGDFSSLRLVDNKTGVNYDMLTNDNYTFEASTDDYASRFYITYACVGVEEDVQDGDGSFAFFDGNDWVVSGQGHLDLVDVLGRTVYSERLTNEQTRVSLNGLAPGVYMLRIADNKNVKVQKIVVR